MRVESGGHHIPEDVIKRRYDSGINNLRELYLPIVDNWGVYNCTTLSPILIAKGDKTTRDIIDQNVWKRIEGTSND